MRPLVTTFVGAIYGFVLSFVVAFLFNVIGSGLAGGYTGYEPFGGERWIYYDAMSSCTITYAILAYYLKNLKRQLTAKKFWVVSAISALGLSLILGTVGNVLGEYIARGGMETIPVAGLLGWGVVYALILLPISIPLMSVTISLLARIIKVQLPTTDVS